MISKQQKPSQNRRIKFYTLGLSLKHKVSFVNELTFYFFVKMYTITIILFEYVTLSPTTVELLVLSVVYVPIPPGGGGGGTQQSFIRGGSAPRSKRTLTLLYTIFDRKGTPFVYLP